MLFIACTLLIIAILILWQARRRQTAIGLPAGRVIYADMQAWRKVEEPLYDADLGLVGKPDYLVQQGEQVIPVEVKSSRVTAAPYDAHIFQVAVYCLLVERHFGTRPSHAILHYPNRTFAVDYTKELEKALLKILDEVREKDRHKDVPRSHEAVARCNRCGFRAICNQRLM
jgi:CRISPR-associated exonuclease Cas4